MPGDDDAAMAERLQAITIGPVQRLDGPVRLDPPNPDWPRLFAREAARIRDVLRGRALVIEHVGSTSVPDLAAKPIIDMLLLVVDSTDETNYVPALEAAGYVLRHREPDWYQHRLSTAPTRPSTCTCFLRAVRKPSACCASATGCAGTRMTAHCMSKPSAT
jgi:GrpB-like predicted nucleotidyltransferase (UPF0157 family)